jgi:hypothetical protein
VQKEQIIRLLNQYEQRFIDSEIEPVEAPGDEVIFNVEEQLSHCYSMIPELKAMVAENRLDEVNHLFGFFNGVFWSIGDCTLEDLKPDNINQETGNAEQESVPL